LQPTNQDIQSKIYSVSKLTADIKSLLEGNFPFVWITGEISNFRVPLSGHFYFTLKDETAQISAVMFRGQNRNLKFTPEDGLSVTGLGRLSVYEPRGSYQIIFELLEPKGVGALQLAFEQLKARLSEEGLFDDKHKKPLPFLPRKIGIITSPSGAAVQDIIKIVFRRYANIHLEIVPVRVQGDGADKEIADGLELVNSRADIDVSILARGGGSIEDLSAFNSEMVARAIFKSEIPIISAVGHETDFTIADFVSDLRAPTPSAAAELVVPVRDDLIEQSRRLIKGLTIGFYKHIEHLEISIRALSTRLTDPRKQLQDLRLRIDDLTSRSIRLIANSLEQVRKHQRWWNDRLFANNLLMRKQEVNEKLDGLNANMLYLFKIYIKNKIYCLDKIGAKLDALNPRAILERGYSITRTIPDATIVKNSESVYLGQNLEVLLDKGSLTCRVGGKSKNGY
jgi:exodeoxyribonuclease VII large subunit